APGVSAAQSRRRLRVAPGLPRSRAQLRPRQPRHPVRSRSPPSRGGKLMNRVLEDRGGRVLAFGAHPDDLEVGAGGLLARLSEQGAEVTLAIVSIPNNTAERRVEAKAA